jgi:uncharacterized protein (DUF305 family)
MLQIIRTPLPARLALLAPAALLGLALATPADVKFMQGMIAHHAQAIEMAALVPTRTTRSDLRTLAQRIDVSQKDEIAMMQRWLTAHHETAPDPLAAHEHAAGAEHAPGMLTPEQMAALGKANGAAFDRLFLTGMIQHHWGAVTMVAQLFATPGAAQDSDIFRFASDVDADQRAEIARMRTLLATLSKGAPK